MGIEPTSPAWEAGVLPMNYICMYLSISLFFENTRGFPDKKFSYIFPLALKDAAGAPAF